MRQGELDCLGIGLQGFAEWMTGGWRHTKP